jgi:hypothetical protein
MQEKKCPSGVSLLKDCQYIVRYFREGNDEWESPYFSLIVSHANSFRALVMHLDQIPSQEIEGLKLEYSLQIFITISTKRLSRGRHCHDAPYVPPPIPAVVVVKFEEEEQNHKDASLYTLPRHRRCCYEVVHTSFELFSISKRKNECS